MVADGMGGTVNGEKASEAIRDRMDKWFQKELGNVFEAGNDFEKELAAEWQCAANDVNSMLNSEPAGKAGTTLTMLMLFNGTAYTANIGDSRIYQNTNDGLYQITEDHSWVQSQLAKGRSMEDIVEDENYEVLAHKLTRCLGAGVTDTPEIDFRTETYDVGDVFLLCSDGLVHTIPVAELESELGNTDNNTKQITETLINTAKERGERDNITAVIIRVGLESGQAPQDSMPLERTQKLTELTKAWRRP